MSADRTTDRTTEHDRPPTDHEPLPVAAAAERLGISPNAVHQRRKRGTLYGRRGDDGAWVVWVPVAGRDRPATGDRHGAATGRGTPTDRAAGAVDAGMVALVDRLTRDNAELAAAAALWQERARGLSERLAALESGVRTPAAAVDDTAPPRETAVDGPSVPVDARDRGQRHDDTRDPSPGPVTRFLRWVGLAE